ncbi:MAG: PKD domain-containing protein [Nevskiaceae bacterium]
MKPTLGVRRSGLAAALLACALCAPPAEADEEKTWVLLESQSGDPVGGGQTLFFDGADRLISVFPYVLFGEGTRVEFDDAAGGHWRLLFKPPFGTHLVPGEYPGATNEFIANRPRLDVMAPDDVCLELDGWFEILPTPPGEFAANFKAHCDGAPAALFGAVRVLETWPVVVPHTRAIAGVDATGWEGEPVTLDGRMSYSLGADSENLAKSYAWTQTAGPSVTLQAGNTAQPTFIVPPLQPGGADFEFRLDIVDALNRSDSDTVRVHAPAKSDPQTYIYYESQAGDLVGHSASRRVLPDAGGSADIAAGISDYNGDAVFMVISGAERWTAFFEGQPDVPLAPGVYEGAARYPDNGSAPGLWVSRTNGECDTVTGRFEVLRLVRNASGGITQFAANFEQHCNGGAPALIGEVRFNYSPPGQSGSIGRLSLLALAGLALGAAWRRVARQPR